MQNAARTYSGIDYMSRSKWIPHQISLKCRSRTLDGGETLLLLSAGAMIWCWTTVGNSKDEKGFGGLVELGEQLLGSP
jgi:hypothetical protein